MSADLGLQKLVDLLNSTRRQAELSISTLNEQVAELNGLLVEKEAEVAKVSMERDLFKSSSVQLKQENNQKWRLQERDDWKSLVDSIQKDRARLQDECHSLQISLDTSLAVEAQLRREIAGLRTALEESNSGSSSSNNRCSNNNNNNNSNGNIEIDENSDSSNRVLFTNDSSNDGESNTDALVDHNGGGASPMTPVKIKTIMIPKRGGDLDVDGSPDHALMYQTIAGTPHTVARRLKLELERATQLLDEERRIAETERQSQIVLINRLQNELVRYNFGARGTKGQRDSQSKQQLQLSGGAPSGSSQLQLQTGEAGQAAIQVQTAIRSGQSGMWSFPVGSLLISLFVGDSRANIGKSAIFHV